MDHLCACSNNFIPAGSNSKAWFYRPTSTKSFWVRSSTCYHPEGVSYCIYHSGSREFRCIPFINNVGLSSAEALSRIVKTEGILSLWSGLSPTLVMALPQTIIYYSVNDLLKYHIKCTLTLNGYSTDETPWIEHVIPPFVGAISRLFSVITISPLELMRTKMQSKPMTIKAFYDTAKSTVARDGIRSLWMGVCPTLLRDVPFSAIFWYTFDYFKNRYCRNAISFQTSKETTLNINFSVAFFYGATAGFVAGVVTHPFDVIKTHRQLELGEALFGKKPYTKSTWAALKHLYGQKGLQSLYSGFTPRLLKTTTSSALMVSIFEAMMQNLTA
ncbi:hypothetical protein Aperf_G00000033155 [Anoplocephala perfoliata]